MKNGKELGRREKERMRERENGRKREWEKERMEERENGRKREKERKHLKKQHQKIQQTHIPLISSFFF